MSQSKKVTPPNVHNMEKEALQALNRGDQEASFWPEEVLHLIDYIKELKKDRERLEKLERWLAKGSLFYIKAPDVAWELREVLDVTGMWRVHSKGPTLPEAIDNLEDQ